MPKRKCVFSDAISKEFPSFKKVTNNFAAFCGICNSNLSIAHKGRLDIIDHLTTDKQKKILNQPDDLKRKKLRPRLLLYDN